MKLTLILLFAAICGCTFAVPPGGRGKIADKVFLEREKNLFRLLMHVHQPNTFQDQVQIAKTWNIEANLESYTNVQDVKDFIQEYHYCYLPRGQVFSIMDKVHAMQAKKLFKVFYYAKDFDTFYKTACWARDHINEGMFVYVFTAAVLHRPDCQGFILPAPYEIYPYYFLNSDVIQRVYKYHLQNYVNVKNVNNIVYIPANYSGWYLNVGDYAQLTYFTEDVGLNSYYYYFNLDYPYWLGGEQFGLNKDRRGELYLFFHQQILARYYMERLSHGLGKIPLVDYREPVEISYTPSLQYHNGLYFPFRPSKTDLIYDDYTKEIVERIHTLEVRLRNAIDSGYVLTEDGNKIPLINENGMNVLGNMIQGNPDSPHRYLYGFLPLYLRKLYGFAGGALHPYKLQPSALEHYETSLRDPAFYSIYKKIINLVQLYKEKLPAYTYNDLVYQGVKIENVDFDKLITYFDYYDFDLNNVLYTDYTKEYDIQNNVIVKARQMRLNHKPFTYRINLVSEKAGKSVVRVYIGPKYDEYGHEIPIQQNRLNFFLLDKFVYDLKVGKNVLERHSRQAYYTVRDRTSYYTLYQKIMLGLQGSEEFILDNSEAHCGFPNRLILPKGRKGGITYQVYVVVTPFKGEIKYTFDESTYCGVGSGSRYMDNLPLGYPFDRPINGAVFNVPNIYHQDVVIWHKREEDINAAVQY